MKIMVTGGAGFIGSAVCRLLAGMPGVAVVNVDKLTYAASLESVAMLADKVNYSFHKLDICDRESMLSCMQKENIDAIMHLAAESHVDRSIDGPGDFIQTNIVGTFTLLQAAREHFEKLPGSRRDRFRFHHISTDEVFGDLPLDGGYFTEDTAYHPSSPYSASKASSDHLVRAWNKTYGLPAILSNCSNNYGPYQFPEKLIPLMILNAFQHKPLPVYGKGENVRDWLYVEDHARALADILLRGEPGQSYNVGGHNERSNLAVVETIAALVDDMSPSPGKGSRRDLITFVTDRPGHDLRYAIEASKIKHALGWMPQETFESGIAKTVRWYLDHQEWWQPIREKQYAGQRLGGRK